MINLILNRHGTSPPPDPLPKTGRGKCKFFAPLRLCGDFFFKNATTEALNSTISKEIKSIIENAKVYGEGRGFRIDITNKDILEDIKKLIMIKLNH